MGAAPLTGTRTAPSPSTSGRPACRTTAPEAPCLSWCGSTAAGSPADPAAGTGTTAGTWPPPAHRRRHRQLPPRPARLPLPAAVRHREPRRAGSGRRARLGAAQHRRLRRRSRLHHRRRSVRRCVLRPLPRPVTGHRPAHQRGSSPRAAPSGSPRNIPRRRPTRPAVPRDPRPARQPGSSAALRAVPAGQLCRLPAARPGPRPSGQRRPADVPRPRRLRDARAVGAGAGRRAPRRQAAADRHHQERDDARSSRLDPRIQAITAGAGQLARGRTGRRRRRAVRRGRRPAAGRDAGRRPHRCRDRDHLPRRDPRHRRPPCRGRHRAYVYQFDYAPAGDPARLAPRTAPNFPSSSTPSTPTPAAPCSASPPPPPGPRPHVLPRGSGLRRHRPAGRGPVAAVRTCQPGDHQALRLIPVWPEYVI